MIEKLYQLTVNPYFHTYLRKVVHANLETELIDSLKELKELLDSVTPEQLKYAYAPEKWTLAEVIGHCIETEMIFNYRALTIARTNEGVTLPGFDQDEFAQSMDFRAMSAEDILNYASAVRQTTLSLLKTISADQMKKIGVASGSEIQVEGLFYITSGHFRYHISVIRDKYLG